MYPTATRHSGFILRCSCYLHGCRCGFWRDATRECRCTPGQIQQYLGKISGPLLDRIDIHVEVPAVPYQELRGHCNSRIPARMIRKLCALDDAGERTLETAVRRMGLSARAHDRILKVARTVAGLGGLEGVLAKHVAEAVQYRSLDCNYWS